MRAAKTTATAGSACASRAASATRAAHCRSTWAHLDGAILASAIGATFARRCTPLPTDPPVALRHTFSDDKAKRLQWQAFVKKGHLTAGTLPETVTLLHALLWPATQVAASGSNATAEWRAAKKRWR
jgi:hypothetical protein